MATKKQAKKRASRADTPGHKGTTKAAEKHSATNAAVIGQAYKRMLPPHSFESVLAEDEEESKGLDPSRHWDAQTLAVKITDLHIGLSGYFVKASEADDLATLARMLREQAQLHGGLVLLAPTPAKTTSKLRESIQAETRSASPGITQRAESTYKDALKKLRDDKAFWISSAELATLLGSKSSNAPDFLKRKRDAHLLPCAKLGNSYLYPAVAVSTREPALHPWLSKFNRALAASKRGWPLMLWLHTPTTALRGEAPHQVLARTDSPDEAFTRYASRYQAGLEV